MIDGSAVGIAGRLVAIGKVKGDSPVSVVALGSQVSPQLRRVKVSDSRFRLKSQSIAGGMHAIGKLGILGTGRTGAIKSALIESADFFENASEVKHIEATKEVNLSRHALMALHDFLVNQASQQRTWRHVGVAAPDTTDPGRTRRHPVICSHNPFRPVDVTVGISVVLIPHCGQQSLQRIRLGYAV